MPVVLHESGFRFVIYLQDHEPPHTHVFKGGGEVVINLGDDAIAPFVRENRGMKRSDLKKAVRIAGRRQIYLLLKWGELNG